jgi:3-oxoacyl-[acyl-carrier-protein] synthase-1
MVAPSGDGAIRCIKQAMSTVNNPIDYINAHGTSTPIGDIVEIKALKQVFGNNMPLLSSTKSLSGHALGAAGVHEAIYCLLMMQGGFVSASANINNLDEGAKDTNIIRGKALTNQKLNTILSNSFGFGGTNACLIFQKYVK